MNFVYTHMTINNLSDFFSLSLQVQFTITQLALSGLKVNRLDIYGEKYKPFKGVKYITKAGRFQVRTWGHMVPLWCNRVVQQTA